MKYKVIFKSFHIGDLVVNSDSHEYTANKEIVEEVSLNYPIFDILKNDITAKCIPFFKMRLEHNCEPFETDDYELIAY